MLILLTGNFYVFDLTSDLLQTFEGGKGGSGSRFTKNKMAISRFTGNKMAISR